jgi:hypothetical protein
MTKKTTPEVEEATVLPPIEPVAEAELQAMLSIGLKADGSVTINSSINNLPALHWMLNKSIYSLNLYEGMEKPKDTANGN